MLFNRKPNSIDVTGRIDAIENAVYSAVKQYGFREHRRNLYRFVSGDISQAIEFQCGQSYLNETHLMWVRTGINVPECKERRFDPIEIKKYYSVSACNIRSSLGEIKPRGKEMTYDLKGDIDKITESIVNELLNEVIPVFNILSSREAILLHRRDYPTFDTLNNHLILLDESMIYGHMGDLTKAKELFYKYRKAAEKRCKNPSHFTYLDELAKQLGFAD